MSVADVPLNGAHSSNLKTIIENYLTFEYESFY
jgi:hypothetical protein